MRTDVPHPYLPGFDLDWRPERYGEAATEGAAPAERPGGFGAPAPELAPDLAADPAPWGLVELLAQVGSRWLAGERLPYRRPREVEIARLHLAHGGECALLARRMWRERAGWRYRLVDERGSPWMLVRRASVRPLTLGELVQLIDTAVFDGLVFRSAYAGDLTDALREIAGAERDADIAARFVRVASSVYPRLAAYYEAKAALWRGRHLAGAGADADDLLPHEDGEAWASDPDGWRGAGWTGEDAAD